MSNFINPASFFLPEGSPLPVSKGGSPLKRKEGCYRSNRPLKVTKTLLFGDTTTQPTQAKEPKKIRATSGVATNTAYLNSIPQAFIPHAKVFESLMQRMAVSFVEVRKIRRLFVEIVKGAYGRRQAELGVLYYYICEGHEIPAKGSLFEARLNSIHSQCIYYLNEHQLSGLEGTTPSGYIAYLTRAFVMMMFTRDGGFNFCGCLAVKELLNSPLNQLVPENLREQILIVVEQLTTNDSFRNLLQNPFEVHPDLKNLILTDQISNENDELSFVYVRWSLLKALFLTIGQTTEPNCYALAPVMNLLKSRPDIALTIMIDALKTGAVKLEGREMPITMLIHYKSNQMIFNRIVNKEKMLNSPFFTAICEATTLGDLEKEMVGIQGSCTVNDLIKERCGTSTDYAKEIFLSHKKNPLQEMMVAILQFISNNSTNRSQGFISLKAELLERLEQQVLIAIPVEGDPEWEEFCIKLFKAYERHFFLVSHSNLEKKIFGGRIYFENHSQGLIYDSPEKDYKAFGNIDRLFFALDESHFEPVDTLVRLASCLIIMVGIISSDQDSLIVKSRQEKLKNHLKTQEFRQNVAQMLADINKPETLLNWQNYYRSDSFCLADGGGHCNPITSSALVNNHFDSPQRIVSSTVLNFFENICQHIRERGLFFEKDTPLLVSGADHAFNLHPFRFRNYLNLTTLMIEALILTPAESILSQIMTTEKKERALSLAFDESRQSDILPYLSLDEEQSPDEFCDEVYELIDNEERAEFERTLETILQEINFRDFEENFTELLKNLNIRLSHSDSHDMINLIREKRSIHWWNSYDLAQLLQQELTHLEPCVFLPLHQLESAIRNQCNLPDLIDLGNLNWTNGSIENVEHVHLFLKYKLLEEEFVLIERFKGVETAISDKESEAIYKGLVLFNTKSE